MTKAVKESDASTDRLLRRALHADAGAQATPECADAETLAAWVDGALASEAIARLEQHASGCARCQALLASMARTAPATVARPWRHLFTARWIVPIAAAATALILWVAVDRERSAPPAVPVSTAAADRVPEPAAPEAVVTPAPVPAPAQPPEPSAADTQLAKRALEEAKTARSPSSAPNRAEKPSAAVLADARREKTIDAIAPKADALGRTAASAGRPAFMSTPPPAAPAPPTAAPPTSAAANAAAAPAGGLSAVKPMAETVSVREAPALRAGIGGADVVSPEPAFRWRLVAPATIQRSTDGGATWTAQSARAPVLDLAQRIEGSQQAVVVLTAGSAPARDICWIVGRGGVVMLSTDGTSWQRRPFPEPVNLTAVRATDAKTAVVITQDGRQFSTADGGATWSKIP